MNRRSAARALCALFLLACLSPAAYADTSRVLRITLPGLVLDEHDAEAVLYFRDGGFHHGYAVCPARDNLVHRVDVTPSPAVAFHLDGRKVDVPDHMRGNYSYKHEDFGRWKGLYDDGKLTIEHPDKVQPLSVKDGVLAGELDLLLLAVDEANTAGRNSHALVYRLRIAAEETGGRFTGKATAWQYDDRDDTYGADSPKRTLEVTARWDEQHWAPAEGTGFAAGTDWPMAHGPTLTASAAPHDGPLIHNLHDARLVWVAEDTLPSGRAGTRTRGDFAMFPFAWGTIGYGGYGAPIIADDKVFVYVHSTDLDAVLDDERTASDPFLKLGVDPRALTEDYKRDAVYAFDAQTGKRLWVHHGKTGGLNRTSKSGMASTPCFFDDKVYVRGNAGLYALDADTGELLWLRGGEEGVGGFGINDAPDDGSVVQLGGTLILVNRGGKDGPPTTIGLDPADGSVRWHHRGVGPRSLGLPGRYEMDGKTYAVLPRAASEEAERPGDGIVMIDPATGEIEWESDALKSTSAQVIVWEDIAVGNTVPGVEGRGGRKSEDSRVGAARLSASGAKRLWEDPALDWIGSRTLSVVNDGVLYTNTRQRGFNATDVETGERLGHHPHIYHFTQGSHNWTWHVAANDRVLVSGVAMFTAADKGFDLLPGRLSLDITGGYSAPTKPAIADGRIVMRLADKLVCYDLRQEPGHDTEVIELVAENALVGLPDALDNDIAIRIRKDGDRLISIGGKAGRVAGPERADAAPWGGSWAAAMPWRKTVPRELTLTQGGLSGPVTLRLGWQHEPWTLDLERDGDTFTGTYTRTASLLPEPIAVNGHVDGALKPQGDGTRRFDFNLRGGIGGLEDLKAGRADENLTVIVTCKGDHIVSAWAACGRMNVVLHEVDPSGLKVEGNKMTGELVLVTHDDEYQDLHFASAEQEFRDAARGPAVAARYAVDLIAGDDNAIAGSHEGTVGVAWEHTGKVSGELKPDAAP